MKVGGSEGGMFKWEVYRKQISACAIPVLFRNMKEGRQTCPPFGSKTSEAVC